MSNWMDVTTMNDNYQVEMDIEDPNGRLRHRRFSFGGLDKRAMGGNLPFERTWSDGAPPSGYWSKKKEIPQ